jgi:hypothetical protein
MNSIYKFLKKLYLNIGTVKYTVQIIFLAALEIIGISAFYAMQTLRRIPKVGRVFKPALYLARIINIQTTLLAKTFVYRKRAEYTQSIKGILLRNSRKNKELADDCSRRLTEWERVDSEDRAEIENFKRILTRLSLRGAFRNYFREKALI